MISQSINVTEPTEVGPWKIPEDSASVSIFINPNRRVRVTVEVAPRLQVGANQFWVKIGETKTDSLYKTIDNVGFVRFTTTGAADIAVVSNR